MHKYISLNKNTMRCLDCKPGSILTILSYIRIGPIGRYIFVWTLSQSVLL